MAKVVDGDLTAYRLACGPFAGHSVAIRWAPGIAGTAQLRAVSIPTLSYKVKPATRKSGLLQLFCPPSHRALGIGVHCC